MGKILCAVIAFFLVLSLFTQKINAQNASGSSASLQPTLSIKVDDNRVKIIKNFLDKYNSPLAKYANTFVERADNYGIDWKLVASISGVESTFGKHIPYNSYNGWGWGVYGNNVMYFSSWENGIETVSKGLRENYINKWGAENVYEIGKYYASSPTWASRVTYFMEKMEEFKNQKLAKNLSISL